MQAIKNNNNIDNRTTITITRQTAPIAYALNSSAPFTKARYTEKLKVFFDFIGIEGNSLEEKGLNFLAKANQEVNDNNNPYWIEDHIQNLLIHQKQRVEKGEIGDNTVQSYYWPIKAFCRANKRSLPHDSIDWDMLFRILPKTNSYSNDICPTVPEIRKVIKTPDRRVKPMVLVMCSSGIRVGAWDYLKWKHVIPINNAQYLHWKKEQLKNEGNDTQYENIKITDEDETKIIAAKLIFYNDEKRFSHITPEAYYALEEWMMDYRKKVLGEDINGESWLMINLKLGFATAPKKLAYEGVKKVLSRALKKEGVRKALPEGKRRHEFKEAHGYRKFFETYAGSVMHPYNIKLSMDHELGVEASYHKPSEMQRLDDYLKAVPKLTIINNNNHQDIDKSILQKQVEEIKEKSERDNYAIDGIKGKLAEKEKEIEALARKAEESDIMKKEIAELRKKQKEIDEKNKEFESTFEKWKRWDQMEESEVEAELEEMRKSHERVIEIEKEVATEREKRKRRKTEQQN